jgi:hypothetical protein
LCVRERERVRRGECVRAVDTMAGGSDNARDLNL